MAPRLLDDRATRGETQPSAHSARFGGEERIEQLVLDFIGDAYARIADPQRHIIARGDALEPAR